MRKVFFCLTLVVMLAISGQLMAKTQYKVFRPEGAGKSEFLQSGKTKYRYFVLDEGKTINFQATGPTKIKLRVRGALEGGIKSANFEVQVWNGNELVTGRKVVTRKSKLNTDLKGVEVGFARDLYFNVPKGKHNYDLKLVSSDIKKSFVRFYQEKKKKKPKYVSYKPAKFKDSIRLKGSKTDITYYLIDNNGGADLTVIGPAEIMIYCRTNFDKTIKDKSKFALGIFENGEAVKKFSGIAKSSSKMVYSDRPDLIPSTLHKYKFNVPSGKHNYTLKKVNSAAPNISVRFRITENSLGKK